MEIFRDFIPFQGAGRSAGSGTAAVAGAASGVDGALALLREVVATAVGDAALFGFQAAADFAGTLEELWRTLEYLQIVAVGAVDRTRKEATAATAKAASSWTTGWRENPGPGPVTGPAAGPAGAADAGGGAGDTDGAAADAAAGAGVVDDGYRNTTEFLRARLRIGAPEARRRLSLAGTLLPRQGFTGGALPAVHGELGAAVAAGDVPSRSATFDHPGPGPGPARL